MEQLHPHAYQRQQIQLLLEGSVDYVEAGDCRIPGKREALRAVASGDAARPIILYEACELPGAASANVGIDEAIVKLMARRSLIGGSDIGPAAQIFTVKNRKSSAA